MRNFLARTVLIAGCLLTRGVVASDAAAPDVAAGRFKQYAVQQVGQCLAATIKLRDRIAEADLAGAQQAWLAARGGWERSEVIGTELFPDLDTAIDAWPNADHGFHAIEARLFGAHAVDVLPMADELLAHLREFDRLLRTAPFTAQELLNGSARLTYEIGESKADGGESPFSGNSLAEIGANITAIRAVYRQVFEAVVRQRDSALADSTAASLARLGSVVAVPTLADLDQGELRRLSEAVAADWMSVARETGLQKPDLGN